MSECFHVRLSNVDPATQNSGDQEDQLNKEETKPCAETLDDVDDVVDADEADADFDAEEVAE